MDIAQFSKTAPYLVNPLVLGGFVLLIVCTLLKVLLKAKVLKPVKPEESPGIIQNALKYVFFLALVIVILGFSYATLRSSRQGNLIQEPDGKQSAMKSTNYEAPKAPSNPSTITQQAGPCSSNIAGSVNVSTVDCRDKDSQSK